MASSSLPRRRGKPLHLRGDHVAGDHSRNQPIDQPQPRRGEARIGSVEQLRHVAPVGTASIAEQRVDRVEGSHLGPYHRGTQVPHDLRRECVERQAEPSVDWLRGADHVEPGHFVAVHELEPAGVDFDAPVVLRRFTVQPACAAISPAEERVFVGGRGPPRAAGRDERGAGLRPQMGEHDDVEVGHRAGQRVRPDAVDQLGALDEHGGDVGGGKCIDDPRLELPEALDPRPHLITLFGDVAVDRRILRRGP